MVICYLLDQLHSTIVVTVYLNNNKLSGEENTRLTTAWIANSKAYLKALFPYTCKAYAKPLLIYTAIVFLK